MDPLSLVLYNETAKLDHATEKPTSQKYNLHTRREIFSSGFSVSLWNVSRPSEITRLVEEKFQDEEQRTTHLTERNLQETEILDKNRTLKSIINILTELTKFCLYNSI